MYLIQLQMLIRGFLLQTQHPFLSPRPSQSNQCGLTTLGKHHTFPDKVENIVVESKHIWSDVLLFLFALQSTCITYSLLYTPWDNVYYCSSTDANGIGCDGEVQTASWFFMYVSFFYPFCVFCSLILNIFSF